MFVAFKSDFAATLVQATVQQDLFAVVMDHVHGAGNRLGSAPKLNFHVLSICMVNWTVVFHSAKGDVADKTCHNRRPTADTILGGPVWRFWLIAKVDQFVVRAKTGFLTKTARASIRNHLA